MALVLVLVRVGPQSGFIPGVDEPPRREQGPAAMAPGRVHGLYVVDVIDEEWVPVFLTTTVGPATARRGGRPGQSPIEVWAKHQVSLSGVGFHWGINSHCGSKAVSQRWVGETGNPAMAV